ncbi:sugar nucleotide-binding protein [Streptomyces mirabilis]|uniref:sugar nucleotide-binding protein n=1 Tax=Streptomyces mirabilis TaxID=68239 RepID=UPI002E28A42A|nr:sugar nucleotide-binding protein [Streptomyces mirabilis]
MTSLITGGSGFLGAELTRQARAAGHTTAATYYAKKPRGSSQTAWYPLDLRDAGRRHGRGESRLVVNASSVKDDWAVTAQGPVRLAMATAKYGSGLIQVSSDAVFSGAGVMYDETCLPDPVTSYGAAKAAAGTGILAVYPEAVVARTSLIVGGGRSVHERAVHELVAGARDGVLFTDDVRCESGAGEAAVDQVGGSWMWRRPRRRVR